MRKQSRRGALVATVILCFLAAGLSAALAYPRPGRTERASLGSDGEQADGFSIDASVSADGRYVAFRGLASNLVAGDTNGASDVFVRDRSTGVTERVSVAGDGSQATGDSSQVSLSQDGRFVAFKSAASNLVAGDTNLQEDVFVHDRTTGTTERVSVATNGTQANAPAHNPSLSADGRYVTFASIAPSLVGGQINRCQFGIPCSYVFIHDRESSITELVSVGAHGEPTNGSSYLATVSADGRYVAFRSAASNLVAGDTNDTEDVFVRDRETDVTERISVASDGTQANNGSWYGAISADGRYVAFESLASNLVPADSNSVSDVFVRDRETGTTERISVTGEGAQGNNRSLARSVSSDGRYVAFDSLASNLVPGDTNGTGDVFVHDRHTGATERVSVASDGAEGGGESSFPWVSAGGRYVAFNSFAPNLVFGDTNGTHDVFVRDRGRPVGVGELSAIVADEHIELSGWATFSGQTVASASDALGDGLPGAGSAGADLAGVSLIYRPENEDLLVRLRVASLPGPPVGGAPAVVYGLRIDLGDARYEVRALRAGATAVPPAAPHFALYRCEAVCLETARLTGGIGTTGDEVRVAVPLSDLGAEEGTALSGLRAFTALGEAAAGELATLDEVVLPDATLPAPTVTLGIAPAGTPEDDVAFDTESELADGDFSGSLDVSSLSSGSYDVWARACLGDTCGAASAPVTLGAVVDKKDTSLELTVEGKGQDMVLRARLTELDAPQSPVVGRTIDFYSDGEPIGSEVTDADGIATIAVPPGHRGANRTYEAVFEGDDLYSASSDDRPGRGASGSRSVL